MKDWQGPAIWIYNDAEFDFQILIKLGTGGNLMMRLRLEDSE
jgi:hypothetical protein